MTIGITFKELTEVPIKRNETKNQLVDLIRSEADLTAIVYKLQELYGFQNLKAASLELKSKLNK